MNELIPWQIACPYCGEVIDVLIDPSVPQQNYIEDCQVCCRPIVFELLIEDERIDLKVFSENETV